MLCSRTDLNGLLLSARKQLVIRTDSDRCKWAKVLFNELTRQNLYVYTRAPMRADRFLVDYFYPVSDDDAMRKLVDAQLLMA